MFEYGDPGREPMLVVSCGIIYQENGRARCSSIPVAACFCFLNSVNVTFSNGYDEVYFCRER